MKKKILSVFLALVLLCSFSLVTAVPAAGAAVPTLSGYEVITSPSMEYGDGGWGGWSVPEGKVVLGGGFYATAPVSASAPGTPNSVWPHYTYGANEYGWVVRDAPDGVPNTITIYAICADPPAGYEVVESSPLNYSDGGWGGWSVQNGKVVLGGGFVLSAPEATSAGAAAVSVPGTPGSVWPHYTYGDEYGWCVRAAVDGVSDPDSRIYVIYAYEPAGYGVVTSVSLEYGDGGWAGWSVPAGKVVLGGGFNLTGGPASVSVPGTPDSVWPHYTYGPHEYGWVVRDAPDGASSYGSTVYAIYASLTEVWVDDGWVDLSPGDAADGHTFGYDAFATIQDGINAVAAGGTVNVAAGDYGERVTINKGLTLLGANAGRHPAVGTHPTEPVGPRVEEAVLSQPGTKVVTLQADDITIDGFKFTGEGHQTIYGYADSNNFHLTNCIFDTSVAVADAGVIEFTPEGSLSHTDMVFDFNLFQGQGVIKGGTIYAGGYCDRLRIAYNKFNSRGTGVFWAAAPLVDGIIEGNEFDGIINEVPGVGGPGLNIGKGGNIIIRNNWFHDMCYAGFEVGIIGGSVIGNIFEDSYPAWAEHSCAFELWGGEWGTPVSTDVTIASNTIRYNDIAGASVPSHGIRLGIPEASAGIDGSTIHIHLNNFEDGGARSGTYAISHQGEPGTVVDAENNWWGDASGPYHLTNPDGLGGAVSNNVDFSPWFGNEAGTTIVHLVTGPNPPPVVINGIATVGISGGDASQGTIGGYSEPGDPTGLFVGTDTTGVVFLDVKVTGYTDGIAHITVPYPDTDQDGIVDGTTDPQVFEHTLGLYYWDEAALPANSMWRLAGNNTVHPVANTVSGDIPVSALTGTPIGLGGYEALVAIDRILNLSNKSDLTSLKPDTVELTIKTNTAFLGAATIDLIFDPMVVEVLGVVGNGDFDTLMVNLNYVVIGSDTQIARFLAYQSDVSGEGVDATDGAVVAVVQLKAVGSTMDFSPLILEVITLKDNNLDRIPRTVGAPSFALVGGVGDANRDTYVDAMDLVDIECAILGLLGYSIDTPTMNVDGKDDVDAADCTYLARHLAGVLGHPLPPLGWIPPWAP